MHNLGSKCGVFESQIVSCVSSAKWELLCGYPQSNYGRTRHWSLSHIHANTSHANSGTGPQTRNDSDLKRRVSDLDVQALGPETGGEVFFC